MSGGIYHHSLTAKARAYMSKCKGEETIYPMMMMMMMSQMVHNERNCVFVFTSGHALSPGAVNHACS